MEYILTKNSPKIREILKSEYGLKFCTCCEFKDAVWLSYSGTSPKVHGMGYTDTEMFPFLNTPEKMLRFELEDMKDAQLTNDVHNFGAKAKTLVENFGK